MTQTIEKGARVKVTFEANYYDNFDGLHHRLSRDNDGLGVLTLVPISQIESIEVVKPPERDWQPGDVVVDDDGDVFIRTNHKGWTGPDGTYDDTYATRPLTLIREAQ